MGRFIPRTAKHVKKYDKVQRMDQQRKYNNADMLEISTLQSNEATNLNNTTRVWPLNENPRATIISEEELKIRNEVEMDIERDLEAEIKDGICHLALRLHRLYQHRNQRRSSDAARDQRNKMEKAFCEVNINIKMEGGTKIEIKESKRSAVAYQKGSEYMKPSVRMATNNTKKFDWAKTLRSSSVGPAVLLSGQKKRCNMASVSDNKFSQLGWKV